MLTYHPALDPYHSALRIVRIMAADADGKLHSRERLQILDFYLTFPHLIAAIRLPPKQTTARRSFGLQANEYYFSGDPKLIFQQMNPLQDAALRLLVSTGIVREEAGGFLLDRSKIPPRIDLLLRSGGEQVLQYVVHTLGAFPVSGKNGLKDRTGLLEHKYDAV